LKSERGKILRSKFAVFFVDKFGGFKEKKIPPLFHQK